MTPVKILHQNEVGFRLLHMTVTFSLKSNQVQIGYQLVHFFLSRAVLI